MDGKQVPPGWASRWLPRALPGSSSGCTWQAGEGARTRKRVLYFALSGEHFLDLRQRLARLPGAQTRGECLEAGSLHLCFGVAHQPLAALERLHAEYFNLVILDLRSVSGGAHTGDLQVSQAMALLDAMDNEPDIEARYGFHRILALVSGGGQKTDDLIAALAQRRVGRVLRDPHPTPGPADGNAEFAERVLNEMRHRMLDRRPGATALCCAGGGITAIYFEMGALKCIDDCVRPAHAVNRFDMYFGISAGAVVASIVANGYTIDDGMAALCGVEGGPIPPMNLSVFKLALLDRADIRMRMSRAVRGVASSLWRGARGRSRVSLESLFLDYSDLVGPPLQGNLFEKTLNGFFTAEGRTNDFRELKRRLYIGVTDQDLRTHVLMGEAGTEDVPISLAAQASLSINPAFSSILIKGRYYSDGAVTTTSHMPEAIRRGADLVLNVDSFVPVVSREPGYTRQRGFLYNIDQDVRTLSYTRFERIREAAMRAHPDISSYTFLPANSLRKLLSINPMDHRPFLVIWRAAYLSTLRRILRLRYRMAGDLALHGMTLDTARAEEVAARLRAAKELKLQDFFPNGRLELSGPKTLALPPEERPLPELAEQPSAP